MKSKCLSAAFTRIHPPKLPAAVPPAPPRSLEAEADPAVAAAAAKAAAAAAKAVAEEVRMEANLNTSNTAQGRRNLIALRQDTALTGF